MATVARVDGIDVTVVSDSPVVADGLRAADIVPRDGALVAAASGRVLDAHADRATISPPAAAPSSPVTTIRSPGLAPKRVIA